MIRFLSYYTRFRDAQSLSAQLGGLLKLNGWRIATAESVTAGRIAALISMTSGASEYLEGGDVVYNIDRKVQKLGVGREEAALCDCVSKSVAEQMAIGSRQANGNADIGIATTGYCGAYPEQGITEPYAWVAIDFQGHIWSFIVHGKETMSRTEAKDLYAREAVRSLVNILGVQG